MTGDWVTEALARERLQSHPTRALSDQCVEVSKVIGGTSSSRASLAQIHARETLWPNIRARL